MGGYEDVRRVGDTKMERGRVDMKVGREDSEENMIGFAHSCTVLLMLYNIL